MTQPDDGIPEPVPLSPDEAKFHAAQRIGGVGVEMKMVTPPQVNEPLPYEVSAEVGLAKQEGK